MLLGSATAHAETTGWDSDGEDPEPTVSIVSPEDGAELGSAPASVTVETRFENAGFGVISGHLLVDGEEIDSSCDDPAGCVFQVELDQGEHSLQARMVEDSLEYMSPTINVSVGEAVAGDDDDDDDDDDDHDDHDHDDHDDSAEGGETSKGCSVHADGSSVPAMAGGLLLLAAGAMGRRRRRR